MAPKRKPAAASAEETPAKKARTAAEDSADTGKVAKKKGRKSEDTAAPPARSDSMKPKEIAALIAESTPWEASLRPATLKKPALHVMSWNVNGLNSLLKSSPSAIKDLVEKENVDVLFLQETKLQQKDVEAVSERCVPEGWGSTWACSGPPAALGYSGVAAMWRKGLNPKVTTGISLAEADHEGRALTLELDDVVCVGAYVPNAGDGLCRLDFRIQEWEKAVASHLKKLQAKKPVIYCGDLNVCHKELDLWGNHAANTKSAGYSPQERAAIGALLEGNGLVDAFRHAHPNVRAFSYWSYRFGAKAKNNGWRLDYHLVSSELCKRIHDAYVLPDTTGSDHCPIGLVLK